MKYWIVLCSLLALGCQSQTTVSEWTTLFNGEDLNNWTIYLGRPDASMETEGLARDSSGGYTEVFGIGNDPLNVFSVVEEDGEPAIHVSGQVFGVMVTPDDYSDSHISIQFKWGEKKWAPRLDLPRDAGLLYHGFGEPGDVRDKWIPSQECQVQQGDCGDYWPVGEVTMQIPAEMDSSLGFFRYAPEATRQKMFFSRNMPERRVLKSPDNEYPHGQWNTIEVLTKGDSSIHIVNGEIVMRLFESRKVVNGVEEPLTSGKISLQSEGAELFYRDVKVRSIPDNMTMDEYWTRLSQKLR